MDAGVKGVELTLWWLFNSWENVRVDTQPPMEAGRLLGFWEGVTHSLPEPLRSGAPGALQAGKGKPLLSPVGA